MPGSSPTPCAVARDPRARSLPGLLRLYCLWARRVLEGSPEAWPAAVATLRGAAPGRPRGRARAGDKHPARSPVATDRPGLRGRHPDLGALAVAAGDYETAVKAAVALGHDTDTTAAVAGGIAGIHHGRAHIPARWLDALRGRELYEPLLERLLAHAG